MPGIYDFFLGLARQTWRSEKAWLSSIVPCRPAPALDLNAPMLSLEVAAVLLIFHMCQDIAIVYTLLSSLGQGRQFFSCALQEAVAFCNKY